MAPTPTTAEILSQRSQAIRTRLQPELQKMLAKAQFDELDKQKFVPFGSSPIVLGYFDFYEWLAANDPAFADFNRDASASARKFIAQRADFLGKGTDRSVADQLIEVGKWPPGQVLMTAISSGTKQIFIVPDFISLASGNYDVGGAPIKTEDGTSTGMPINNPDGTPATGGGRGTGSNYILNYSPELYGSHVSVQFPGDEPDATLFHELVHALRSVVGVLYFMEVDSRYDNEEEYLGVVLTNIYLSSQRKTKLRGDHYAGILQERDQPKFLDNVQRVNLTPRMLLERFRLTQQSFFTNLAGIEQRLAEFNPVRQYNDELKSGVSKAGMRMRP